MKYRKIDITGDPDDYDVLLDSGLGEERKNICRHDVNDVIINPPSPPLPPPPEGFLLSYYETYEQFFNLDPYLAGTQKPNFSMGCISHKFRNIIWIHKETSELEILNEKIGKPETMILCGGVIDPSFKEAPPEKEPSLIWRVLFHNRVARFIAYHSYLIMRLLLLLGIAGIIWFVFFK